MKYCCNGRKDECTIDVHDSLFISVGQPDDKDSCCLGELLLISFYEFNLVHLSEMVS